jgi:hypothetical protein
MTSRDDRKLVKKKAMATAKEAQHGAAESLFGAIVAAVAAPGVPDHPRLGA